MNHPDHAPDPPLSFRAFVGTMACLGVVTGLGELGYHAVRKYFQRLFVFQSADALWMTPLADALLFSAAGAGLWLLCRATGRPAGARRLIEAATTLGVAALLLLFAPLHKGGALLLALGAGAMAGRSTRARHGRLAPAHRLALPLALSLLAGTAATIHGWRSLEERRGEARLRPGAEGAPSVLLIILDTVRAWNLSLYGYPLPTSPNLERRAEHGVRFARAFATAPWTLPTHASLFTGREAHQLDANWYVPLDDSTPTLAEVLRSSGYRTGGFVANLPYTSRETGLDRGFLHYEDHPISLRQLAASASLVRAISGSEAFRDWIGTRQLLVRKHAPEVSTGFLSWLDQAPGRPFFAFLNYYDAHQPYVPPAEYLARFLPPGVRAQQEPARRTTPDQRWDPDVLAGAMAGYDAGIAFLDDELERLFAALESRGLLSNTLVIVTSDHGEEFGEHGLIDHGSSLNRAALEVPLVFWFGDRLPAGRVVTAPVSLRDLPATITDLLGLAARAPLPGRTLRRFWTDPPDTMPMPIFSELRHAARQPAWYPTSGGDMLSVIDGGMRYVRGGDGSGSAFALSDSLEASNLVGSGAEDRRVGQLRALVDSVRPRTP